MDSKEISHKGTGGGMTANNMVGDHTTWSGTATARSCMDGVATSDDTDPALAGL